ncbi:NAD(P)/FAD-dependent oxidoreductase [Tellurirhabdus bombi]|uniref:NAD(P)/FAD-dependent oxidoreductase n=1 Tax=Tellurirhabdus bombi TaxID=2907205 RepID=UPI001F3E2313|nr:NAD(P)/FAD-dependent oxidoreductase [Tellurirhabdus bombi]
MNTTTEDYEIIIVGGSFAGLSAALVLGRSLRQVLVLDSGQPANRQTPHSHGFLTRDGDKPTDLLAIAREQALAYPTVRLLTAQATTASGEAGNFVVTTDKGDTFGAKRLLLATGLTEVMPALPGFAECWGISILHCPYCHGYEVKDEAVGILANGDKGFDMMKLIQHWSPNLTLFTNGPSTLTPEQTAKLKEHGLNLVETPVIAIQHNEERMTNLLLSDQTKHALGAMYAHPHLNQKSDLAQQLSCEHDDLGFVKIDEFGRTNVEGVYAAGDTQTMQRQVLVAAANGLKAATTINRELIWAEF